MALGLASLLPEWHPRPLESRVLDARPAWPRDTGVRVPHVVSVCSQEKSTNNVPRGHWSFLHNDVGYHYVKNHSPHVSWTLHVYAPPGQQTSHSTRGGRVSEDPLSHQLIHGPSRYLASFSYSLSLSTCSSDNRQGSPQFQKHAHLPTSSQQAYDTCVYRTR